MDANFTKLMNVKIGKTIANLEKNGMNGFFVPSAKEALALLKTMLVPGETIAVGGSVTLAETGALDLIKSGTYKFIDRYKKGLTKEQDIERRRQGLLADTFVMSSNAITEDGKLYNVDGTGNRVAALIFGPKRVIILAGWNKIVPDLRSAINRVQQISAPANAIRLCKDTYCVKNGHCMFQPFDPNDLMFKAAGACKDTVCRTAVVTGNQSPKGRITVIIIGENLGY